VARTHRILAPYDRGGGSLGYTALALSNAMSTRNESRHPTSITVHQRTRVLEVGFDDGKSYRIPFELLRVYSPSAEVQGHGPGQEVLQTGKRDVEVAAPDPVGNYAVQPRFSDGHDTGIYSCDYLYFLGSQLDVL